MEKVQTNISTIPITIKVIEVGNKKMTISVFNQIPFNDFYYSYKDTFLGWVSYKEGQYVLFTKDGILLKDLVYEIPNSIKYEYKRQKERGRTDEDDYITAIDEYERLKKYKEDRYKDLLNNKNQIYIAV